MGGCYGNIGIVPVAAVHEVCSGPTVQPVVADAAIEKVASGAAVADLRALLVDSMIQRTVTSIKKWRRKPSCRYRASRLVLTAPLPAPLQRQAHQPSCAPRLAPESRCPDGRHR